MDLRLPDGTVISNIPDGTTQKQLLDKLSQNGYDVSGIQRSITKPIFGREGFAQSAKEVLEEKGTGPAGKLLSGVASTFDRAAYGLKGLFTDLSPQDKGQLMQNAALQQHTGPWGTAGEIAGDVALTAPAFAAGGAVAGPAVRAALPRALPQTMAQLTGAAGGGAAAGALMSPEDRAGGAFSGGIGGAAGYGVGRVLTRALGGALPATGEARELMQEGVRVPIHQAGEPGTLTGDVTRRIGESARRFPVAGAAIRSQEARALQDWNRNFIRDVTPPRPVTDEGGNILRWVADPITEVSDDSVNLLRGRFREAYDAVYRNRRVPLDQGYRDEIGRLAQDTEAYFPHLAPRVQGVVNRITNTLARGTESTTARSTLVDAAGRPITQTTPGHAAVSADAVKTAIREADEAVTNAYREGNGELADVLRGLRDSLEELRARSLPPEVAASLQDVNAAYARFKPLADAFGMMGAQRSGMVTPRQVLAAMRSGDRTASKAAFEGKNVPGQRRVLAAQRVLANELPDVGPGTADALALAGWLTSPAIGMADLGATALLGTAPGQRFLGGAMPWQAAARTQAARQAITGAAQAAGTGAERERREQLRRALVGSAAR